MSGTSGLVSVIIPAFNAERHIAQTLESVLVQSYRRLEVIVVDDGSEDRTSDIARNYARKDSRLKLLCQSNRGVAAARNRAIAESNGEFIAPIDADDLWCPSKVQRQVETLSKSPSIAGLVYVWSQKIDESNAVVGQCSGRHIEGSVYLPLLIGNFIGNSSAPLIRRECFEAVGGYDEVFWRCNAQGCEDWDLYLRIAERYRFSVIPDCLVRYRQTAGGMSADTEKMKASHRLLLNSVRKRHPSISSFVYRWSTSAYMLYVANTCTRGAEPGKGLACLLKAACLDPPMLLNMHLHRLFFRNAARILGISAGRKREARFRGGETASRDQPEDAFGAPWTRIRDRKQVRLVKLQRALGLEVTATPDSRRL